MFDKLIDFLLNILDLFRFWVVVREGNRAVIYTLGKPTRTVGPQDGIRGTGLHPKWPFWIELEDITSIRDDIYGVPNQSLMTSDGKLVHVRGCFRIQVLPEKVEVFQTTLGDEDQATTVAGQGAIADTVS